MSDEITHRLSTEGVDPLALAGVNDGNLVALAQRLGVRVSLRGDTLMLHGPLAAVERAVPVAQALVDLVRMGGGEPLDLTDVDRVMSQEQQGPISHSTDGEYKIILPGLRRVIQAKTAGQRSVRGRRTSRWPRPWMRWHASECGASCSRALRWRRGRTWDSSPAMCTRRSTHTCGRCTTRWRT